jgi:hypothetical protein
MGEGENMKFSVSIFALAALCGLFSPKLAPAERPSFSGLGGSCVSSDPNHLCLGLKYVVYRDANGRPVSDDQAALANLRTMNKLWAQCGISFQLEVFSEADPSQLGLNFHPSDLSEMDSIRTAFSDPHRLVMVTTGSWNRRGSLGENAANAWTAMPKSEPYGSVFEAPVATYSEIYSHEMGHYLNLDHSHESEDLMNPVIFHRSTRIRSEECGTARNTASVYWAQAVRS